MKKIIAVVLVFTLFLPVLLSAKGPIKVGDSIGVTQKTDIVACINGYPLASYAIHDTIFVKISDFVPYGFGLRWDGATRSTYLTLESESTFAPLYLPLLQMREKAGKSTPILFTDIQAYVDNRPVETAFVDGQVVIPFSELKQFGTFVWDGVERTSNLWLPNRPICDYTTYLTEKEGITPLLSGDAETDFWVSVLLSRIFKQEIDTLSDRQKINTIYCWMLENEMESGEPCKLCKQADTTRSNSYGFSYRADSILYGIPLYLAKSVLQTYASQHEKGSSTMENWIQAYGSHMILHRQGESRGFSALFKLLVNHLGFSSEVVEGNLRNPNGTLTPHSWNSITIGNSTYWVDVDAEYAAWVSMGKPQDRALYYFLQSDGNFEKTHEWKKGENPVCKDGISYQNMLNRINADSFPQDTIGVSHPTFRISSPLRTKMADALKEYDEDTSFYLVTLDGTMSVGFNIDGRYPCASVIKAPYALYSYQQLEAGNGTYDEKMAYQPKHTCGRSGVIQHSPYGTLFSMRDILYNTIHESDNIGYYMLCDRFKNRGYQELLKKIGCSKMVYASNTRWGDVYPREFGKIWNEIFTYAQRSSYGKRLFQDFLEAKYNFIKDAQENSYGSLSYPIAHKSGFNDTAYHDTGIVFTEIPYFVTVMTASSGEKKDKNFLRTMSVLLNEVVKEYIVFQQK